MKKIIALFYTLSLFFSVSCFSKEDVSIEKIKDGIYLKFYVSPEQVEFLKSEIYVKTTNCYFITNALFSDGNGMYLRAQIVDGFWLCPACGLANPDWSNECGRWGCPFSKKK
ncbi:MAG TPA: hypothetical protein VLG76_02800 [Rhabdochlamydiaceae bacterium]|nr:hypothetical protein [Rhabdochlamydiaceae bacterium]